MNPSISIAYIDAFQDPMAYVPINPSRVVWNGTPYTTRAVTNSLSHVDRFEFIATTL